MEPQSSAETKRIYTLREAAEFCGVSLRMLRARADRGTLQTVMRDGERHVPHAELERVGLLPGAEVRELKREVERLERQLVQHRQLVENIERDRQASDQARRLIETELHEQRAAATTAAAQLHEQRAAATTAAAQLRELEEQIARASWRERRQLRKQLNAKLQGA